MHDEYDCMSYSTKSKKVECCKSFFTSYFMLCIVTLQMDKIAIKQQLFLIVIQKDSTKSFALMVAHYEELLEYSIINQQVIHSFEIDSFKFLNLLK